MAVIASIPQPGLIEWEMGVIGTLIIHGVAIGMMNSRRQMTIAVPVINFTQANCGARSQFSSHLTIHSTALTLQIGKIRI